MIFGSESLPLHQCDRAFQLVKLLLGKKIKRKDSMSSDSCFSLKYSTKS